MPLYAALQDLQKDLQNGVISTEAIVRHYLERIEATRHLNIYVEVFADEVLAQARRQDEARARGEQLGRLAGLVVSIKDVICYAGHAVTAGSRILEGFTSLFSATAVERLLAEDAIIIGRTNCDEFAMGSTNETSYYGPTRNAANPDYVPGGSSGGAAVAVQADTCLAALGSDTGGSVRQPATFCGLLGLKPTYGRISRHGLLAYGSSFDQIGVLSHSIDDMALLLEIMAGPDEYDSTAWPEPAPAYSKQPETTGTKRIAYLSTAMEHQQIAPAVKAASEAFLDKMRAQGHEVSPVALDLLDYLVPAYYVLTTAEASSNLSRYDGIRYGYRSPNATNLQETYEMSRTEGFGPEVRRRIMMGAFVLSSGYYDAYFARAQKVRRLVRQQLLDIFEQYDFLFMPVAPTPPWPLGQSLEDPVAMYLSDIFTVAANIAGLPALALPAGEDPGTGLPIGVQLMGAPFTESELLGFAKKMAG